MTIATTGGRRGAGGRTAGFTLIELLVVIAVLGILITMLVPTLSHARTAAKKVKIEGMFYTLKVSLEMFHEDDRVGGEYPPSKWDMSGADDFGGDPYGNNDNDEAQGAETLLWALSGADYLGTPGFGGPLHRGDGGLYEIGDGSPVPVGVPVVARNTFLHHDKAEVEEITLDEQSDRKAKVYVDSFDMPVLYYRADPAATTILDTYRYEDNMDIIHGHPLAVESDTNARELFLQMIKDWKVHDVGVDGLERPNNADNFILWSAGPDKQYGTHDDMTNFTQDQRNLPEPE